MAPVLEALPSELFEAIVEHLELVEIGNLRLTGRNVMIGATQRRFRSFFTKKRVRLTKSCLESFVAVTKSGSLGLLLEQVTLYRGLSDFKALETAYMSWKPPTALELEAFGDEVAIRDDIEAEKELGVLLGEAFRQLKLYSNLPHLMEIHLEDLQDDLTDYEADEWIEDVTFPPESYEKRVQVARFEITIRSMRILASALHRSGITMSRLSLSEKYKQNDATQPGYVPMNHLAALLESEVAAAAVEELQEFSVTLANSTTSNPETGAQNWTSDLDGQPYYDPSSGGDSRVDADEALNRLLKLAPNVRKLHLRWYGNVSLYNIPDVTEEQRRLKRERHFFDSIFPYLSRDLSICTLDNIKTNGSMLLSFVQATSLRELTLWEIFIEGGSFRDMFDYLTRPESTLELLDMNDLFQERLLFFPKEPGKPNISLHSTNWPAFVLRKGSEVRKPLEYAFRTGRSKGSAAAALWIRNKHSRYGFMG